MKVMEIGVFLTNLGINDLVQALKKAKEMGFSKVHLGPETYDGYSAPSKKEELKKALKEIDIEATTVFIGFHGEDYSDVPTVQRTAGFGVKENLRERIEFAKKVCDFTSDLGVKIVAAHVGFIPEDENSPMYRQMFDSISEVVDYAAQKGLIFSFETGQEKPETLLNFIKKINFKNVMINFDTVNLMLYGKAKSIDGISILRDYIINVHIKDGYWPKEKDKIGDQAPIGKGEADIRGCIKKLAMIGYKGPLIIEREGGEDRIKDILEAKKFVEGVKKEIGII